MNTNIYQAEKSFDKMEPSNDSISRNRKDFYSQLHLKSHDSKSIAAQSECLSEHYIRAKKFAA